MKNMIARSIAIIYPFEKFFKTNSTCFTFGKLIIFFHCDLFKSQFKIFSINEISFFFFPWLKLFTEIDSVSTGVLISPSFISSSLISSSFLSSLLLFSSLGAIDSFGDTN